MEGPTISGDRAERRRGGFEHPGHGDRYRHRRLRRVEVLVNSIPVTLVGGSFETTVDAVVGGNTVNITAVDLWATGRRPTCRSCTGPTGHRRLSSSRSRRRGDRACLADASRGDGHGRIGRHERHRQRNPRHLLGDRFEADVALVPGENTIVVTATDVFGSTATASVTVSFVPDVDPPTVVIDQPTDGETVFSTPVVVSGHVSDETSVTAVYVNGLPATLVGDEFSASVELTPGSNWMHRPGGGPRRESGERGGSGHLRPRGGPAGVGDSVATDGETVYSSFVTVIGTATDASGIASRVRERRMGAGCRRSFRSRHRARSRPEHHHRHRDRHMGQLGRAPA